MTANGRRLLGHYGFMRRVSAVRARALDCSLGDKLVHPAPGNPEPLGYGPAGSAAWSELVNYAALDGS